MTPHPSTAADGTAAQRAAAERFRNQARQARDAGDRFQQAAELVEAGDLAAAHEAAQAARHALAGLSPERPVPHAAARAGTPAEPVRELRAVLKLVLPGLLALGLVLWLVLAGTTGDIAKGYSTMSAEEAARATAYPAQPGR